MESNEKIIESLELGTNEGSVEAVNNFVGEFPEMEKGIITSFNSKNYLRCSKRLEDVAQVGVHLYHRRQS